MKYFRYALVPQAQAVADSVLACSPVLGFFSSVNRWCQWQTLYAAVAAAAHSPVAVSWKMEVCIYQRLTRLWDPYRVQSSKRSKYIRHITKIIPQHSYSLTLPSFSINFEHTGQAVQDWKAGIQRAWSQGLIATSIYILAFGMNTNPRIIVVEKKIKRVNMAV